MQRLALSLGLLLICGAVSAEQITQAPATAPTASPGSAKTVPANTAGAAKTAAAVKPAAKMPPAKELFGAVAAPAPLAARA
ncbi:MAG: hypothetical protein WB662_01350, partial [Methyloceanibacter sp.]